VRFTGEAPAVKELSAVFVAVQNHVTVRCLPMALPHDLETSLQKLTQLHSVLTVADLVIPGGVKVKDAPETVLATVQEKRKEEEIRPAAAAAPEAAAVEGVAPAAEGAAPTAEAAVPAAPAVEAPAKKEKKGKE
jgi:hypothetical protein